MTTRYSPASTSVELFVSRARNYFHILHILPLSCEGFLISNEGLGSQQLRQDQNWDTAFSSNVRWRIQLASAIDSLTVRFS